MRQRNSSVFARVLGVMLCVVMLVLTMSSCAEGLDINSLLDSIIIVTPPVNDGTNDTADNTTNDSANNNTNDSVEDPTDEPTDEPTEDPTDDPTDEPTDEPYEEPVDPNRIYLGSTEISEYDLLYGALVNDCIIGAEGGVGAILPSDVKIENGASSVSLLIKNVDASEDLLLGSGETMQSLDVHISGISKDNKVPMTVNLGALFATGLKDTELKMYHIENGTPVLMTKVNSTADFALHNQYVYDSETGEVSIYVSSFSVFSAVQATVSTWDGSAVAEAFEFGDGTEQNPFVIKTAEQFVYFRNQVDAGVFFEGQFVKLASDIDLNNHLFDPIGFGYTSQGGQAFKGTFDGGNHTVYNLYQNGWDLDESKYCYSTAGGGLFASIENATIKNLVVSGANIIYECVDIGIVVGYAQGNCHFENIVVTNSKIANYNRATGAVVGEVCYGSYGTDVSLGYSHTFRNIIVDSSVKVSSLWGSFDTLCGGIIGGKWGDATVKMENVIVACELDVFSDVTAAYQWYAYRRCGMLIGNTEQNSPKKALNAAAEFLTCENVTVYYGEWVNYTYYEFADQDSTTGQRYPWVRAEAGEHNDAFSNPRYGVPTYGGVKVVDGSKATNSAEITFGQLYGGGQGVYGCNEHTGVSIVNSLASAKTVYIKNNVGLNDLKLQWWFANGSNTWTTNIDGISMASMETNVEGVYKVTIPSFAAGFKITSGDGQEFSFTLSELAEDNTYNLGAENLPIASVDGVEYSTLAEAIANANGKTVVLIDNATISETIVIEGITVTLDLNGKTISVANNTEIVEVLLVKNGAKVTVTGNGTMLASGEGDAVDHVECISAIDDAIVTIMNGTFISEGCTAIYATRGAKAYIYGGHFEAKERYDGRYFTLDVNEREETRGTIIVYGGTYVNFDPSNHTIDGSNYQNKLAHDCLISTYNTDKNCYEVLALNHNFVNGKCECGAYRTSKWEQVTDAGDLKEGDKIIVVAKDANYALGSQATNNRTGVEIIKNDGTIIINENVQIIILEAGSISGTFAFNVGNGYLYAASTSNNYLKTQNDKNVNSAWTITITDGVASIVAKSSENRNVMQYNPNKGSPLFSCYASASQKALVIYKLTSEDIIVEDHKCANFANGATCEKNARCTECGEEVPGTALVHDYTGANPYICENHCGIYNLPEAGSRITIQQALWIAETLENGKETSFNYVISGEITDKNNPSDTGATTISDGDYKIHITNIQNADGTVRHDAFVTRLKNGDKITVSAKIRKNDSGEAQLKDTRLASHTDIAPADHTCDICGVSEITDHADENSDNVCDICDNTIDNGSSTPDPIIPSEKTVSMDIHATKGNLNDKVITWTSGDVTVSNAQGSSTSAIYTTDIDLFRVYANSTFSVSAPGISKVIITCTSSSYATACETSFKNAGYSVTVSGSVVTVTLTSPKDEVSVKASAQFRINNIEVTYMSASSEGEDTTCKHANTGTATVDATCTTPGTITVTCNDCKEIISTDTIDPLGHTIENGICKNCGEEFGGTATPEYEESTLSFSNASNRTELSNSKQVWTNGAVTFTNNKGSSTSNVADYTNPVRCYKSSEIVITASGNITKIVFETNGNDYAKELINSINETINETTDVKVTQDGKTVTVEFTEPVGIFTIAKLAAQIRIDSIIVTYEA